MQRGANTNSLLGALASPICPSCVLFVLPGVHVLAAQKCASEAKQDQMQTGLVQLFPPSFTYASHETKLGFEYKVSKHLSAAVRLELNSNFPLIMRQKYTQEQNEAFYLDAAKMYQETFGVNNCISPSGAVAKEVFFPAYRDRFGYGLGLFTTKEEAKRMRDGITKFFKAMFVEKMERYTDKGIAFEQIMFRVTSEFEPYMLRSDIDNAVLLFKKSLDKQIVQLQNSHVESPRELVSNLNAQIQSQMIRSQARPDAGQSFVAQLQNILDANSHRPERSQVAAKSNFQFGAKEQQLQ
ncbi:Hypothetical_protein [Hexamita inflata]|uniref:Hypothetical_protein n=2 Tax=Hexamita inflata TaxID=28002 RepID=A0AA86P790_9EUKA|nr:Hypothetical protein HINF_LOCUS19853 [Hexamita inflata]